MTCSQAKEKRIKGLEQMGKENSLDDLEGLSSETVYLPRSPRVHVHESSDRERFYINVHCGKHILSICMPIEAWEKIDRAVSGYFQDKTEPAEPDATSSDIHGNVD